MQQTVLFAYPFCPVVLVVGCAPGFGRLLMIRLTGAKLEREAMEADVVRMPLARVATVHEGWEIVESGVRMAVAACLVCLALCIPAHADTEANAAGNQSDSSGVLYHNEDCTNFFGYREIPPGKAGEVIDNYVDVLAEAGVTTLLCNTNGRRTNYDSDAWEPFWEGHDPDGPDDQPFLEPIPADGRERFRKFIANMQEVHEQGIDYPARVIQRARHHGISPWISLRMNDCHYNSNMEHPFHGTFWQENPQFYRENTTGYYARCLDYAHPEVRDYYKALIVETLERYDIDGLELDFMREPYLFSKDGEDEGRAILTNWIREIHALTEKAAEKRGHPVQLGIRVPSRPETAYEMGLDAVTWAREGLIDLLVPTPRWATVQFDMPLDTWRERLGDADVTLAGGLDVSYRPYPGSQASAVSPEMAWGAAIAALVRGADAVYLFNYFQDGHFDWDLPLYKRTLRAMRSLDTLQPLPRRVAVTYREITAPGEDYAPPLPVTSEASEFSLTLGPVPEQPWRCEVMLEVASGEDGSDIPNIEVFVNGQACGQVTESENEDASSKLVYAVPDKAVSDSDTHAVRVAPKGSGTVTIRRVEMALHTGRE